MSVDATGPSDPNSPEVGCGGRKSHVQGENGFTSRLDYYGVQILEPTRSLYTVMGRTFSLRFEIVDRRLDAAKRKAAYTIEVRTCRRWRRVSEGNSSLYVAGVDEGATSATEAL